MVETTGNLFDWLSTHALVIPVNIGWDRNGKNVMGRGVAKDAARLWPTLPTTLGNYHRRYREGSSILPVTVFDPYGEVYCFPVKPLAEQPWLSWKSPASLELIARSADELAIFWPRLVALPRVGCGNGGLSWTVVRPILGAILDDHFVVVSLP